MQPAACGADESLPTAESVPVGAKGAALADMFARGGMVYCVTLRVSDEQAGLAGAAPRLTIVREADGTVLQDAETSGSNPYLWGDRLITVTDIQHRPRGANPEIWQAYDARPGAFAPLGGGWHVNGNPNVHQAVGGYELPVLDAFADGFLFCRVWGGFRCYDLGAEGSGKTKGCACCQTP